jgi:catechol-2,3-dioxygenase
MLSRFSSRPPPDALTRRTQTNGVRLKDGLRRRMGTMRIGLTRIFVEDQDRAERFYTQVVGLQAKTNAPTPTPSGG